MANARPALATEKVPSASDVITLSVSRKKLELFLQFLVLVIGVLVCASYLRHEFRNEFSIASDVSQHTYWMVSFHDPALFKNEFYSTYARSLTTPGFEAIYWVGTLFASPQRVGKTLSVILFGLTGLLYFNIGKVFHGHSTGYLMAFLWIAFPNHTDELDGGLHRAFMHPLIALFAYALYTRRLGWIAWIVAVGLIIYPPSALMMLATLAIVAVLDHRRVGKTFRGKSAIMGWVAVLVAAIVISIARRATMPNFLGPMATGAAMAEDPRFNLGGRSPYLPFDLLWNSLRVYAFNSNEPMMGFAAFSILLIPVYFLRGKNVIKELSPFIALGLASVLLFELAKAYHFKLYIPRRYLQFSPVLCGAVLMACAGAAVLPFLRWPVLKFAAVCVVCWMIWMDARGDTHRFFIDGKYDRSYASGIFRYLKRETPKDSLIAADPRFSDAISVFSSRATLLKYELSHPWYRDYRAEIEQRARDYYALVYAGSVEDIKAIRDKYGIDYFIYDPRQYLKGMRKSEPLFYQPLKAELENRYPIDDSKEYFMETVAKNIHGFQWDRLEVIPLDDKTLSKLTLNPS